MHYRDRKLWGELPKYLRDAMRAEATSVHRCRSAEGSAQAPKLSDQPQKP